MTFAEMRMSEFLDAVASKQPTPGGGAVASVVAALAGALGCMVLVYSQGKKSLAEHAASHQKALSSLGELGRRAMKLAEDDATAYARLNALWKLDKSDPKRLAEFPEAVEQAIAAPHAVLHVCMEILLQLRDLCGTTNTMLASDLAMAAILAEAGARSAAWNVRINLPLLDDARTREVFAQTIEKSLSAAASLCRDVESHCAKAT